jgi:predicted nucleic acid-binding protein
MVLATAGATGCVALISEDMTHGATLGGVQVVRAFDGDAVSPEALALPA